MVPQHGRKKACVGVTKRVLRCEGRGVDLIAVFEDKFSLTSLPKKKEAFNLLLAVLKYKIGLFVVGTDLGIRVGWAW